jgi:dienelactone hydrolase
LTIDLFDLLTSTRSQAKFNTALRSVKQDRICLIHFPLIPRQSASKHLDWKDNLMFAQHILHIAAMPMSARNAVHGLGIVRMIILGLIAVAIWSSSVFFSAAHAWSDSVPWVQEFPVTLPNGDAADLYVPRVSRWSRPWLEDAFPLVAVLQGALVDKSEYQRLGRRLAALGFVAVIPNHFRNFPGIPVPVLFSEVGVITSIYDAMVTADADPDSPLYLIVDTERMGMVGHSLGGFVGMHAIAGVCDPQICTEPDGTYEPPEALQAGAVYGANLIDFDGTGIDLDTSSAPVALVQGRLDGIAIPQEAQATYPLLESPRALISIDGANHYGICDRNNPPGATPDPLQPTLSQSAANFNSLRWIGLWLRAFLKDDPWADIWLYDIGGSFNGVVDAIVD